MPDEKTLSVDAEPTTDFGPRTEPIDTPDGPARIRRMEPEQIFAQLKHFERREIDRKEIATDCMAKREELARFIQRCIVPPDSGLLRYPGQRGLRRVMIWTDEAIVTTAKAIAVFLKF